MAYGILARQLQLLQRRPLPFIVFLMRVKDDQDWACAVDAPEDSPYAGGVIQFSMRFRDDFPRSPPLVQFARPIYHPNVTPSRHLFVRALHPASWNPATTPADIIELVWKALSEPEVEEPVYVNEVAMNQYLQNREVWMWVTKTTMEEEVEDD